VAIIRNGRCILSNDRGLWRKTTQGTGKGAALAVATAQHGHHETTPMTPHLFMCAFLERPAFLLGRLDQICTAIHAELSVGETLGQTEFLLLLNASDARDQISLARAAGVDKSTTALILNNLENAGVIERLPDPADRRRTRPRLTATGHDHAGTAATKYVELQRQLVAPLGETGSSQELVALLRRIARNANCPAPAWAPDSAADILVNAPSFHGRRALQVAEATFLDATASLSLTPRQFSMLFILHAQANLTQAELSRLFGLDPSTGTVIMRNLFARGLVDCRAAQDDRRKRTYALTDAGREQLTLAEPLVAESERRLMEPLDQEQAASLVAGLRIIVRAHSRRLRFPGEFGPCGEA